jgi:hypothetical protein
VEAKVDAEVKARREQRGSHCYLPPVDPVEESHSERAIAAASIDATVTNNRMRFKSATFPEGRDSSAPPKSADSATLARGDELAMILGGLPRTMAI